MSSKEFFDELEMFKIKGTDKKGRKIFQIIGKLFPGRKIREHGQEDVLRMHIEKLCLEQLQTDPFIVVFFHSNVKKSENMPSITALCSAYEFLPATIRGNLEAVYFVHPGLRSRFFLAIFGRLLFSYGLYSKVKFVHRLEFLNVHIRRGEIEVPKFVKDHDDKLEHHPLMDYGLWWGNHSDRFVDAPSESMRSLRCIT